MKNVIFELTRIVQQVALVDSPAEQVALIVDSVSQVIGVDVCSLYRRNDAQEMELLASHGLTISHPVKLPPGKGLVGRVASARHPINIVDPASHPDYFYVADTQEENFQSFCGVPLVRFGEVIGVLVVQRLTTQTLSDESEAFLVTLASQLALIVANISSIEHKPSAVNVRVVGIKGAPGIGIGSARLCDHGQLHNIPDAQCDDIGEEILQWHALLTTVRAEIQEEQAALGRSVSGSVVAIFDAYQLLLADRALIDRVEVEIHAGHWLPGALRTSIHYFSEMFRAMEDPYLKARSEDILHLGNKLFNAWRGDHQQSSAIAAAGPVVLVGAQVTVSDIAYVPIAQLAGIICFEGSSLSHTAVLANAMGIPAVMGVGEFSGAADGVAMIVDGNEGQVIVRPSDRLIAEFNKLINQKQQLDDRLHSLRDRRATSTDGQTIRLFTNTGLLADISPGLRSGAAGVGLYRTEIPFMVRDSFPTEDEQLQVYQKVFEAYRDKPVYMRTLDIGGDKQLPYFPIHNEENPALGWRGIRFTLDNIQLLMTQVRAMIRAADGADNLHILLPMVSSTYELDTFLQLLADACEQLQQEGVALVRPKVGVMVEVPAAISQLVFWADKLDFISVGSNDLSQYLLALDRNNARVAGQYDHVHPAVLHEIHRTVGLARTHGLPLSICGEMASDPVAVVLLLGMGIRTLSMSAAKLPRIKWLIRSLAITQAETMLSRALRMDNVKDIRSMVNALLAEIQLGELIK